MRVKYYVNYSGTYENGEQFSDQVGNTFTRKKGAISFAKEFQRDKHLLRGPNNEVIAELNAWVGDEHGSMVWG